MNTDNLFRSVKQIMNKLPRFCSGNVRHYGHIQSLGYNCEVSFQFFQQYKFNEFDLLIVLQKSTFAELTESKFANGHIFIRRVDFFTPENKVTDKKNDRKAWKKIFKEFVPAFKLKKQKKYKFEED